MRASNKKKEQQQKQDNRKTFKSKVTQRNEALVHLLAPRASSGVVPVCACVYPGVGTPAQTEWVGSVGWREAPWIPLQASSLSGPAKVSLLPGGGSGVGEGDASA